MANKQSARFNSPLEDARRYAFEPNRNPRTGTAGHDALRRSESVSMP